MSTRAAIVLVAFIPLTACTVDQSVFQPSGAPVGSDGLTARPPKGTPGSYELSFNVLQGGSLQPVETLSVMSRSLYLRAYVTDSAGAPTQSGSVTFEYCSFKGRPPNDISRADEAPKEACEDGSATWDRLSTRTLEGASCPGGLGVGNACHSFGLVQIPRTVGFRFRYANPGGGVANGQSAALNFTWY